MRLTSSQVYLVDPLNIMCSRKWETPLTSALSSRDPVLTNRPAAKEWESGLVSAMTSSPLGSLACWKLRGINEPLSVGGGWQWTRRRLWNETVFPHVLATHVCTVWGD